MVWTTINLNGDLLEEKLQQNFMLLMMATLYYVTDFPLKYAFLISLAQSLVCSAFSGIKTLLINTRFIDVI